MSARPTPPCRGSLAFRQIVFPLELCSWLHLCYPCPVNGRAHCSLLVPCSFLLSQPPEIRRGGTLWQPDGRQGLWSAFLAARGLISKAPEHSSKCPRCVKAPSDLLGTAGLRPPLGETAAAPGSSPPQHSSHTWNSSVGSAGTGLSLAPRAIWLDGFSSN